LKNAISIFQNFRIPKVQHAITSGVEPVVPTKIVLPFGVLSAVEFNHQTVFMTDKVDDEGTDRSLAAKCDSCKPMRAKPIPEAFLRLSHFVTQRPGIGPLNIRNGAMMWRLLAPLPDRFAVRPPPQGGR